MLAVFLKTVTVIAKYTDEDLGLEALRYTEPQSVISSKYNHFGDNKENVEHSDGVLGTAQSFPEDNLKYQHIIKDVPKDNSGKNHEGYETNAQEANTISKKQKRASVSFVQNQTFPAGESSLEYGKDKDKNKEKSEEFEREFNLLISELLNVNAESTIFNRLTQELISDYKEKIESTALRSGRTSISFNINFANDEDSLDMVCDSFSFSVQKFYDAEKNDFKKGYFEAFLINDNLDKYELSEPGEQLTIEKKVERRRNQCNAANLQDSSRNKGKGDEFLFRNIKNEADPGFQQAPAFSHSPLLNSSGASGPLFEVNSKETHYNNGIQNDAFSYQRHNEEKPVVTQPLEETENLIHRSYRHLNGTGQHTPGAGNLDLQHGLQDNQGLKKDEDSDTQPKHKVATLNTGPEQQKEQIVTEGQQKEPKKKVVVDPQQEPEQIVTEDQQQGSNKKVVVDPQQQPKQTVTVDPKQQPKQTVTVNPHQQPEQNVTTGSETKRQQNQPAAPKTQKQQNAPTSPPQSTATINNKQTVNDKIDPKKLLMKIKDLEGELETKKNVLTNFVSECNKPHKNHYKENEIKKLIKEAGKNSSQQQTRPQSSKNVKVDNEFSKIKAINTVLTKIEKSIVDGDMAQCRLNKHLLNEIIKRSGSVFFTLSLAVLITIIVMLVL